MDTQGAAYDVAVSGAYVYIADGSAGVQVIDITNPASPQIVGGVSTGFAGGVAVSGSQAYVADSYSGFVVVPAQCDLPSGAGEGQRIAVTVLLRAHPNPASRQTFIHFETGNLGLVQASIYDLVGRRVRGLSDGILGAGVHDLLWDGQDEDGRAVEAGMYLVRVSTAEGTATGRFVIVR
jgi:hypothetical protein